MVLADGIDLPIVAGLGLVTFGPLTLLVTTIECFVFRACLGTGILKVFGRVLAANIISTLAGGLLLMFQEVLVYGTGIEQSIPAFVRGYRWVALLLIVLYWAKSVLVEGFWLTRRGFLKRIERPGRGVLRAVLLANLASYCVVGPLFYFTTRPHFGGLETTFAAPWSTNRDLVVYYLDRESRFIKRTRLDGTDARTLVPHPARSFVVSPDESACAYLDPNGDLYACRSAHPDPIHVWKPACRYYLVGASFSPDSRRLAYREYAAPQTRPMASDNDDNIKILDLETRQVETLGAVPGGTEIAWSADGQRIYAGTPPYTLDWSDDDSKPERVSVVCALNLADPGAPFERLSPTPPLTDLAENYTLTREDDLYLDDGRPIRQSRRLKAGPYDVEIWAFLGSGVRVTRERKEVFVAVNEYGLLNFSWRPVENAIVLPSNDEVLLQWWDQLYLLGIESRKLGLVADGDHFVLRTPEFRVSFQPDQ